MRRIPVDPALRFVHVATAPYLRDGQPVVDPTAGPLAVLTVLSQPDGGRPEVVEVRVPQATAAGISQFQTVHLVGLVARPYSFADSGGQTRSGVSYSADGVSPAGTPAPPVVNGERPTSSRPDQAVVPTVTTGDRK